ncbi:MAG: hypothetical protein ACK4FP_13245 [Azonexus sp.]
MIGLDVAFSQQFAPAELPAAVRAALGKPLRRAAVLTQLALLGACAALPAERRSLPTALLWQSTSGPRLETLTLLAEMAEGGDPMPYDFLATQPALAAAQIQPFLPGLQAASHVPLDNADSANWGLLLHLAMAWLGEGRYSQVLCAQLDHRHDMASGHWLSLQRAPASPLRARLERIASGPSGLPDAPDLPARIALWLSGPGPSRLQLDPPAGCGQTVEFVRL